MKQQHHKYLLLGLKNETTSLTQALNAFTCLSLIKQAHAHLIVSSSSSSSSSPSINLFTQSRLFACACACEPLNEYTESIFNQITNPNVFVYNTLFKAAAGSASRHDHPHPQPHHYDRVFSSYLQMRRASVSPDHFTFPFLLPFCSGRLLLGQQLHSQILRFGFLSDVFVLNNVLSFYISCRQLYAAHNLFNQYFDCLDTVSWTTLLTAYSSADNILAARHLFDLMPHKNTVSWNAIISAYARARDINQSLLLFNSMPQKDVRVSSWSAIISACSFCERHTQALLFFNRMIAAGVLPNEPSLVTAVSSCAHLRSLEQGISLHRYIEEHQFQITVTLGTALLDMYAKCGNIHKALDLFNSMKQKNVITWNSMIAGLAYHGYGKQALSMFWRMRMVGPCPNASTFVAILSGCSHSGLVDEGCAIFTIMIHDYKIRPQLDHYGCLVDLLGRGGLIEEAIEFVQRMPQRPHPAILGSIASACRLHGDVEVGKNVGTHLINMEPKNGGRYALLSNIFAVADRWDDMALVSCLLKERKVLKTRGYSMQL